MEKNNKDERATIVSACVNRSPEHDLKGLSAPVYSYDGTLMTKCIIILQCLLWYLFRPQYLTIYYSDSIAGCSVADSLPDLDCQPLGLQPRFVSKMQFSETAWKAFLSVAGLVPHEHHRPSRSR